MGKEINDKMLIEEICKFCELLETDVFLKASDLGNTNTILEHPLDKDVQQALSNLLNGMDNGSNELSYETSDEIDKLWSVLIEKSIICLRYFDKREPFMNNGKPQYVYGMDKLNKYHKSYVDFEGVLYGSDGFYRDHVFHVLRVWMLGLYLMLTKNSFITDGKTELIDFIHFEGEVGNTVDVPNNDFQDFKDTLDQDGGCFVTSFKNGIFKIYKDPNNMKGSRYFLANPNSFSSEINKLEKISIWTLAALCHDLGYPLEKSKKILNKTEKMMGYFVSAPSIERNLKFDGTQDSNNLDIITFISKKMVFLKSQNEDVTANYNASIQEKYKFKYKLSLEEFSHGIISAIIIYKMLIYFIETDNNPNPNYIFSNEDARQFYIRRDILRAIASHTCENIYHIDVATFPMLLFVCDELQEWGRKSWKSIYSGMSNRLTTLSIISFNAKRIEYKEDIDMSSAAENQIVDNIIRIFTRQYMLYLTTFRDGQFTARREFDFIKHISIIPRNEYKSISRIEINFAINASTDNYFSLNFISSGDEEENSDKTNSFVKKICENLDLYFDKKYGACSYSDERMQGHETNIN